MAKRLTDTEKWKDEWYLALDNDKRIIWQYILDNCDHAGLFKKSFTMLNFCCHTNITEDDFKEVFNGRIIDCGNFFFIPKFVRFQYGEHINSNRPVIKSMRSKLLEHNLLSMIEEPLNNGCNMIKSKSKSKSKVKSKDIIFRRPTLKQITDYCKSRNSSVNPEKFFNNYESSGWIKANGQPVKNWKATIKTWEGREVKPDEQSRLKKFTG